VLAGLALPYASSRAAWSAARRSGE
jgi:hypothetical protein